MLKNKVITFILTDFAAKNCVKIVVKICSSVWLPLVQKPIFVGQNNFKYGSNPPPPFPSHYRDHHTVNDSRLNDCSIITRTNKIIVSEFIHHSLVCFKPNKYYTKFSEIDITVELNEDIVRYGKFLNYCKAIHRNSITRNSKTLIKNCGPLVSGCPT